MKRMTVFLLPIMLGNLAAFSGLPVAYAQIMLPTPSRIAYLLPEGQLNVKIDQSPDLRTAREKFLDNEFPLPKFGLKESVAILGLRLNYAEKQSWLSQFTRDGLANQFAQIQDRSEQAAAGSTNPDYKLSTDVYKLNQAFVSAVLLDEQTQPGREGIAAKEMLIRQSIANARADGTLSLRRVSELDKQLADINALMQVQNLDQNDIANISSKLSQISGQVTPNANVGIASNGSLQ
ncbi:MAG: hypothetical protein K2X81_26340 [Candidatus Obscuribacterales bacterium]|nr:hypothetical protein [Candidatus Obscuribacterales bacterium]